MESDELWQTWSEAIKADLALTIDAGLLQQFQKLYDLLVTANKTTNLTRITGLSAFLHAHLYDSLTLVPFFKASLEEGQVFQMADVGSGAGFPAIPIAMMMPEIEVTAIESTGKKTAFIQSAAAELGLKNLKIETARVEDLAHHAAHREQYDAVTARAVAAMPVLSEYCLPLVKPGGMFYAMKTTTVLESELPSAEKAIRVCGGALEETLELNVPENPNRVLVILSKQESTPRVYPRKAGLPTRKPLV